MIDVSSKKFCFNVLGPTLRTDLVTEWLSFYFYLLYCCTFSFSVKHFILNVIVIIFVHIIPICIHVLKVEDGSTITC